MGNVKKLFSALVLSVLLGLFAGGIAAQQVYNPPAPQPWDGKSRFTLLILGLDRRPGARDTLSSRTDVMILASYDPASGSIGLLHIPRDLHLPLPDVGQLVRVNTLMVLGEQRAEGYGPYYAMETIGANLGMQVDGYVAFDFEAFITLIDAMGGITLNIPYSISDPTYPDMNYGYDPFFIRSGVQQLDGRTALKYARTRHGDNDYLRGQRQLQVIQGVRERLAEPVILQNMLVQAPLLARSLQGHLYSNIPLDQLTFLGLVALDKNAGIVTGGLNESNTTLFPGPEGQVRIPRVSQLPATLSEIFGPEYWN
jgi:LCP family protein required for cell wall assembly